MGSFLNLLAKDLRSEFRAKESLGLQIFLALLLSSMASLSAYSAFFSPREINSIAPIFLWLIFFFTATLSLSRAFEYELALGGLWGVYLSGAAPEAIFLAKLCSNIAISLIGQLSAILCLTVFLNLNWGAILPNLLLLSLGVIIGYGALSTLLTLVALRSKLRGMLLPVILFPLLFPLLFAALELTQGVVSGNGINWGSPWVTLLAGLDVIYALLGINLFGSLLQD